ncbi:MAG: aminotransferase class V-fold PLP-dependent enzyme, partial [Candidatus Nanoarchaeia archaeon]
MNFPLLDKEKVIYLDNAATTQKPQQVLDAINNHYEHNNANVHRGMHVLATRATDAYEGARKKVAKFINASPEEIIFTRGATESLNLAAYSIAQTLKDGDEIIMTEMEHHSNLVPWQQIAKKYGLKVRYIRFDDDYRLDMDHARR